MSDLPNSTNFARSLAGIRRAEPNSEALNLQGLVKESPTARATAPQLPCSAAGGARNRK